MILYLVFFKWISSDCVSFLIRQNIEYGVYLMEPIGNITFNRGILMNIGFREALKDYSNNWNCFFFHDVDMIPENNYNFYKCDENTPIHYAVAVSAFNYKYIFLLFWIKIEKKNVKICWLSKELTVISLIIMVAWMPLHVNNI